MHSHAFRNLPVILKDLALLRFTLDGKYYLNLSGPFGSHLSCQICNRVATALPNVGQIQSSTTWANRKILTHLLEYLGLLQNLINLTLQILDDKHTKDIDRIGH